MKMILSVIRASLLGMLALGGSAPAFGSSGVSNETSTLRLAAASASTKSIRNWVSCGGVSDDTEGVARAFAAASHAAFTLVVDCPVRIHSGSDVSHVIYIDDGTTVQFTAAGKFTVDNVLHPAFVMANSHGIALTDWNVEYDASLPVSSDVGPTHQWNDVMMPPWLTAHRGIVFDKSQGGVGSKWLGPTNTCAVFFVSGDTSDVVVTGMNVHVPPTAGGDRFVPVVFSVSPNFRSNQIVTAKTPFTAQYYAVPHDLTFTNITFDGTYMGWVGGGQNLVFEHIKSHRYGDLQDANGENVGGVGKWFAPPHLLYLSYSPTSDPALFNRNIRIHDVVDDGPRVGRARDKGGTDTISGYAPSLKIGCVNCSVDTYTSTRPDGFMDVLPSDGLMVANVDATYDSAFLGNLYPGWRFPAVGYSHMIFQNILLKDSAACTIRAPVSDTINENSVFSNVRVKVNRWCGNGSLTPWIRGQGSDVALEYIVDADATHVVALQKGELSQTLKATPHTVKIGTATTLDWAAKNATACTAGGEWNGRIPTQGSRAIALASPGNHDFTLTCENANDTSTAKLRVIVEP